jgi:arginyl-tRNA synthetase
LAPTDPISALRNIIRDAASSLGDGASAALKLERPPRPDFGDYSTNAAMLLAPALGEPPRPVAERLGQSLERSLAGAVERVDVAGPGFLNLFMSDAWYRDAVARIADAGASWGAGRADPAERVLVEFVSANPTGPVTVASGRNAAYGDALARLLEFAGNTVEREYYVNDFGTQIVNFGRSIQARARGEEPPEDGYRGDYVTDIAQQIPDAASKEADELARAGVELMLTEIETTLARFRVHMDRFSSERRLNETGKVDEVIELLAEKGHVYESEGAVWLRTTSFGDDKDRVLRRSSGEVTYFASDIAYHQDKRSRGFDRLINPWGADHHGYVERMLTAWEALGGDRDRLELVIMQLVSLSEGGQRAQMSKRQGEFVTLDDLLDDIGVDAARYFLLQRSHDTALDIDLQLAREQSRDNPVYYVQYAHARIASILHRAETAPDVHGAPHSALQASEKALTKRLLEFPEELDIAVERRAPHRLTTYAHDVAQDFTDFYHECKVVGTKEEPFRLVLCIATKNVIARSLELLGVSAPEEM